MKNIRIYYLYTLNDPTTDEIRYVGITCNLQKRLSYHLQDRADTKKTRWIASLRNKNLTPIIVEIKHTENVREVIQWEIDTIAEYTNLYNLTNTTAGGEYYAIGTPVSAYSLTGEFIDTFTSMIEAAEFYELPINAVSGISACCMHRRNYAYNKIWRYVDQFVTEDDLVNVAESLKRKEPKHFYLISLDGKSMNEFDSVREASKFVERAENGLYETLKADDDRLINGFFICKDPSDYYKKLASYNASKPCKIRQYTLDGEYITTFDSMNSAAIAINKPNSVNVIRSCCMKLYGQALGFIWRFDTDVEPVKPYRKSYNLTKARSCKKVYMYDKDKNFLAEYNSAQDAALKLEIDSPIDTVTKGIRACCSGSRKSAYSYIWSYECPASSNTSE